MPFGPLTIMTSPSLNFHVWLSLACLLYVCGCGWVLLFPLMTISQAKLGCRATHVSENALPKHYAVSTATADAAFSAEATRSYIAHVVNGNSSVPELDRRAQWVAAALVGAGASVSDGSVVQESAAVTSCTPSPSNGPRQSSSTSACSRTVVGTVHGSGRLANQEAVVVAVPLASVASSLLPFTPLYAAIRLARTLTAARWLAKDVLFVVNVYDPSLDQASCGRHGFEGWAASVLDGGLQSHSPHPPFTSLLRGAIVLDWDEVLVSSSTISLALHTQGPWGRMPDMDIVTLLMTRSLLPVELAPRRFGCTAHRRPGDWSYADNWAGLMSFMTTMAVGPYAQHAPFISRNTDSVTVSAVSRCGLKSPGRSNVMGTHGIDQLVATVEVFVNAISTLEEKLHASYYFYFLLSPFSFVSFGEYFYCGGLMLVFPIACLLLALTPLGILVQGGVEFACHTAASLALSWSAVIAASFAPTHIRLAVLAGICAAALLCVVRRPLLSFEAPTAAVAASALYTVLPMVPFCMYNYPFVLALALVTTPVLTAAAAMAVATSSGGRTKSQLYLSRLCKVLTVLLSPAAVLAGMWWCGAEQLSVTLGHSLPPSQQAAVVASLWLPVHHIATAIVWAPIRTEQDSGKQD